jgi:hypothetical protein
MAKAATIQNLFSAPLLKMNPGKAMMKAIEKNEKEILDLNRQQLDRGLDADGNSLGRYKNFNYKGRWQPVDLKLTGDFRNRFTLGVDEKKTEFFSQDVKAAGLEKKYGKDIMGIPQSLMPNMQAIIRDDFITEIRNQLNHG